MIRKIKTSINSNYTNNCDNDNNGSVNRSYDVDSRNASVEEVDLSLYTTDNNIGASGGNVSEEAVLSAISDNFASNRKLNSEVNNMIYKSLQDKINSYISNNGGGV